MELPIDIVSWGLLIGGSAFLLIGAIGLIRLPDMFSRMHGAGIIDTLGALMILGGLMLQAGLTIVLIKLLLISLFLIFTSPTTTHALAQAALAAGLKPIGTERETDEKEMALLKELEEERKRLSKT